jgi:hypothetical protein
MAQQHYAPDVGFQLLGTGRPQVNVKIVFCEPFCCWIDWDDDWHQPWPRGQGQLLLLWELLAEKEGH